MRIRTLCVMMLIIFLEIPLFAGDKIDFSGEWTLNREKSVLDANGTAFLPTKLAVTQNGNDLAIKKTFQNEYEGDLVIEENMTLDGKECKSEFMNSPRTITANWFEKGDTLNIRMKISFQGGGETSEMALNEAWSLKEEGKILSIKHYSSSSFGERKVTMVFEKKEPVKTDVKK